MGWRDRAAGHTILEQPDFTRLDALPKPVAFQARLFKTKTQQICFLGTRSNLKKWEKNDDPFSEFAPDGSPKFVKLARETAASFCSAFDELHTFAKQTFPDSQFAGFGPSKRIGELSLGLQIATLLGATVLSFIDDDDPDEAILACVCEPGRLVRARCEKAGIHLLFTDGGTTVSQVTNRGASPVVQVNYAEGFTPPPIVNLAPMLERVSAIPGVKRGKPPRDYTGWSKQLVSQELNAFVGSEIAEPDTVVPSYRSMKLVAHGPPHDWWTPS
jgi:hypothetical protein